VFTSGEALSAGLARLFHERLPGVELHNLYGPTETAVEVTAWTSSSGALPANVPIGRPIANTRIYILDSRREPVPIGAPGEIHIGGMPVGRGYLNRPELTAERFIANPFVKGERLYRTGDVGRFRPDGIVEYLGRNDFQVKIRGFRIELGEIEARLAEHPGVREAAVVAREDAPGDRRLVAFYTARPEAPAPATEKLRAHLGASLPEYMVPAAYVVLESLPLTSSGKLDRNALPAPDSNAFAARGYEPPKGDTEETLARIWAGLLRVERVGRHDNFFELGGHSLLGVRMLSRLRQALGRGRAARRPLRQAHFGRVCSRRRRGRPERFAGDRTCGPRQPTSALVCAAAAVVPGANRRRRASLPHPNERAAEGRIGQARSAPGA
jgi:hypothetical protein